MRIPERSQQERQRQAILDRATQVIREGGLGRVELPDIAKSLGMSKGAMAYYYPSMEHLVRGVMDAYLREVTENIFEWIGSLEDTTPLKEAVYGFLTMMMENDDLTRLHLALVGEVATGSEDIRERYFEKYKDWRIMLENGIMKVETETALPDNFPQLVLMLLDGMMVHRILGMDMMATQVLGVLLD